MAFCTMLEVAPGRRVTVFRNPDGREWRELEQANDPLDGVRGFVIGGDFYAWVPAALHAEVEPLLATALGGPAQAWLPVAVLTVLRELVITSSFGAGTPEACRDAERRLRACASLRRRLGPKPRLRFARLLEEAA